MQSSRVLEKVAEVFGGASRLWRSNTATLIVLTGYGQDMTTLDAAGFDLHMLKPVDFQKLRAERWIQSVVATPPSTRWMMSMTGKRKSSRSTRGQLRSPGRRPVLAPRRTITRCLKTNPNRLY